MKMAEPKTDLLLLAFNGVALPWPDGAAIQVSLHTGDPVGVFAPFTEASYGGYARANIARDGLGWTISDGFVKNTSMIKFPICKSGVEKITHVAIGIEGVSGFLYTGKLENPKQVSKGIQPQFADGELSVEDR
jgi:hypothetical protein